MRILEPAFAAHIASGVTTLCACWRITRRDGAVLCFTDHDRDLSFDSCIFIAGAGIEGSTSETALGLATGGGEVAGVLASSLISEHDLANGAFDGVQVESWRVNWNDPLQRALLDVHTIGEVRRGSNTFTAELRSIAHAFDQEGGRLFQAQCDAEVGDFRCGVDLDAAAFSRTTQVLGGDGLIELDIVANDFDDVLFEGGDITFLTGANTGMVRSIDSCSPAGAGAHVRLWERTPLACAVGDSVRLRAGCDKSFATCRTKFTNHLRFRGFPNMPGNDALLMHVTESSMRMDGGSLLT